MAWKPQAVPFEIDKVDIRRYTEPAKQERQPSKSPQGKKREIIDIQIIKVVPTDQR